MGDAATWTPSESNWKTFTDVNEETPHAKDILWLAHVGISQGWVVGNGKKEFRPYAQVARADMAAFLRRLANQMTGSTSDTWKPSESDLNAFKDVNINDSVNSPHAEDVLWLAHTGISTGWIEEDGTKTFRSFNGVARCDMAAFLHRMANLG